MRGVVRVCVGLGIRYVGVQRGFSYVSLETPDEEYEHYVVSQYCSCSEKKRGVNIRWWRRRAWRSKPSFSISLVEFTSCMDLPNVA